MRGIEPNLALFRLIFERGRNSFSPVRVVRVIVQLIELLAKSVRVQAGLLTDGLFKYLPSFRRTSDLCSADQYDQLSRRSVDRYSDTYLVMGSTEIRSVGAPDSSWEILVYFPLMILLLA